MVDEATARELERILPALHKWALRYETPQYDHEEIVADVVTKFIGNPEVYSAASGSLRNYLFSAIRNRAYDYRKKLEGKWRQLFKEHLRLRAPRFDRRTPQAELCTEELRELLIAEIEKMSHSSGEAFRLLVVDGLGYDTIAERMGKTRGCVKSLIYQARERVKDSLAGYLIS